MAKRKKRANQKPAKTKPVVSNDNEEAVPILPGSAIAARIFGTATLGDNEEAFLNFVDQNASQRNAGVSGKSGGGGGGGRMAGSGHESMSSSSSSSSSSDSDESFHIPASARSHSGARTVTGVQNTTRKRGRPPKKQNVSNAATRGMSSSSKRQKHSEEPRQDPRYNEGQLKACLAVIKILMEMEEAASFCAPVDPASLATPDYFDVIDTPMDFGTIHTNLENGVKYMNAEDVWKDVQHIWENCLKYNKKGDYIVYLMKRVKKKFTKYWTAAGLDSEKLQETNAHSWLVPSVDHATRCSPHDDISMVDKMVGNLSYLQQYNSGMTHVQSQASLGIHDQLYHIPRPQPQPQPQPCTTQLPQFSQWRASAHGAYADMERRINASGRMNLLLSDDIAAAAAAMGLTQQDAQGLRGQPHNLSALQGQPHSPTHSGQRQDPPAPVVESQNLETAVEDLNEVQADNDENPTNGADSDEDLNEIQPDNDENPTNGADSDTASVHQTSGHQIKDPSDSIVGKTYLPIDAEKTVFLDPQHVRQVTNDIKYFYKGAWTSWQSVDEDVRSTIWKKFESRHYWDRFVSVDEVRAIFDETAHLKLKSNLYQARKRAKANAAKSEPHDIKAHGPSWIPKDVWVELIDKHWSTESWKKISTTNSANRQSQNGGLARHTAGSNSFKTLKWKLEHERGKAVTQLELFDHTHKKKGTNGQFLHSKAKAISEKYKVGLKSKYGEDIASAPSIDRSLWLQSIGGAKKGRVYGIGANKNFTRSIYSTAPVASQQNVSNESLEASFHREIGAVTDQVTEIKDQLTSLAAIKDQMESLKGHLTEHIDQKFVYMVQMLCSQLGRAPDSATLPPVPTSGNYPPEQQQWPPNFPFGQWPYTMRPPMMPPVGPSSSHSWQHMYSGMMPPSSDGRDRAATWGFAPPPHIDRFPTPNAPSQPTDDGLSIPPTTSARFSSASRK